MEGKENHVKMNLVHKSRIKKINFKARITNFFPRNRINNTQMIT